eukprot:scaffold79547_cov23-Cyclotella_meneghiniana.AAC.1
MTMTASTSTEDDIKSIETNKHQLVHRYDSPFSPNDECSSNTTTHAALIILNTPIVNSGPGKDQLSGALSILWRKSCYRICADGGANRLYQATVVSDNDDTTATTTCKEYLPDLITGDLDSLLPHVREYYEDRGVPIVRVEDQDYHDLDVSVY